MIQTLQHTESAFYLWQQHFYSGKRNFPMALLIVILNPCHFKHYQSLLSFESKLPVDLASIDFL